MPYLEISGYQSSTRTNYSLPYVVHENKAGQLKRKHKSQGSLNAVFYHPRMRVGNVFSHVCECVYVHVSMYGCLSAITFESLHIETSFLVCRHIFTISRSILNIKVIGSRSRSYQKKNNFTYFNMLILCIWLQVNNKVKGTHQGEGNIKVKVKISSFFPILGQILLISTH